MPSQNVSVPIERFTDEEKALLSPFVTNLESPVFVLKNLPEVVKGALFARYSRSNKSLRRLLLDEFLDTDAGACESTAGTQRSESFYDRVFVEYGDDSVAQLGAVHLACEGASNILTKVLERGRLAAYLEQSTRYIAYDDRPDGRYRYHVPTEVLNDEELARRYTSAMDLAFETYSRWIPRVRELMSERFPRPEDTSTGAYKATIKAKALDVLRGLLPAGTRSNLGLFANGQSLEGLLLRMRVAPQSEVREYADLMLTELRKVIPAFVRRVDLPDRGERWSRYLEETRRATREIAESVTADLAAEAGDGSSTVELTDFDPDGEVKVVAAALYTSTNLPDAVLQRRARELMPEQRAEVLRAYIGERENRRHRPGRAFERTSYRFDVLADYGAFRDLQRHRVLSIDWQPLSPDHGYVMPEEITEVGAEEDYRRVMNASAEAYQALKDAGMEHAAPYAVAMAYRVRFYMEMNAREAMHVIELRTTPQGHQAYREVCQAMHRRIRDDAGHRAIADAMHYVDHGGAERGRLDAEQRSEERRTAHLDRPR